MVCKGPLRRRSDATTALTLRVLVSTHTHMGQVPETTQARAMRGVFVASLMGGAQATLSRHRQA